MERNFSFLNSIFNANSIKEIKEIISKNFKEVHYLKISTPYIYFNKEKITNNNFNIIEIEKIFLRKNFFISENFLDLVKDKSFIIPLIINQKLDELVIIPIKNHNIDILKLLANIINALCENFSLKKRLEKTDIYFNKVLKNLNSSIILRDKQYNILFTNQENIIDKFKCFDLMFNFDLPCKFCKLNINITKKINNKHFHIQTKKLNNNLILCIKTDVTQLMNLKDELSKAQKMNFLVKISQEITHEIKNPLNSIKLKLTLIKRFIDKKDIISINKYIGEVEEEIQRLSNISTSYLSLSKINNLNLKQVNLEFLLNEIINNFKETFIKNNIKINTSIEKSLKLNIDKDKIKQVIINLINNAIEALNDQKEKEISIIAKKETKYVIIEIKDNGPGAKHPPKLFIPFYSTKPDGTGLGLAISKKIIEQHNGSIEYCKEEPWTIFKITLPFN